MSGVSLSRWWGEKYNCERQWKEDVGLPVKNAFKWVIQKPSRKESHQFSMLFVLLCNLIRAASRPLYTAWDALRAHSTRPSRDLTYLVCSPWNYAIACIIQYVLLWRNKEIWMGRKWYRTWVRNEWVVGSHERMNEPLQNYASSLGFPFPCGIVSGDFRMAWVLTRAPKNRIHARCQSKRDPGLTEWSNPLVVVIPGAYPV